MDSGHPQTRPRPYDGVLEHACHHASTYIDRLDRTSVAATVTVDDLRNRLDRPIPSDEVDAKRVIDDLVDDVAGGVVGGAGGRFFGWVNGGCVPAALAADWLTSAWDQNAGMYAVSPAGSVVEEVAGRWLKDLLRLPPDASFALVTGCQMAHVTCLGAARHAILAKHGWDIERRGLFGAPPIAVITSDQRHGTIERAVRLLGLGTDSVIDLPEDDQGRLRIDALAPALAKRRGEPTVVLLQAGDLNIGAYDPFEELIPLAHDHGSWVHVDGAFGLWAAASPQYRHLVNGVEAADSWAVDGHKWLNVPYDCGYAFVADAEAHRKAIGYSGGSYLTHANDARDQLAWNPEWSRRARGIATYAAIRQLGRAGIADLIERTCRFARDIALRISDLPGAECVWEPQINQGLVRFLDPNPHASAGDHDRRTDEVMEAILQTGEAFFTGTTWRGRRCMRVSVCNWRTDESEVDRVVAAVEAVLSPRYEVSS